MSVDAHYPEDTFYADCAIFSLESFIGESYPCDGGMIICPGAWVYARINTPEDLRYETSVSVHTRSTFARLGLDMCIDQGEYQRIVFRKCPLTTIRVTIINEGNWPVMVREGDTVAVMSRSRLFRLPVERIDLHAGTARIEIIEENLPVIEIPEKGWIRYIDPSQVKRGAYTRVVDVGTMVLWAGDYVVMSVKEHIAVPDNRIAIVTLATEHHVHFNSSVIAYPGWSGYLAMEFKVHQDGKLVSGDLIAWLLLFQNYRSLISYKGKYNGQEQKSIEPR